MNTMNTTNTNTNTNTKADAKAQAKAQALEARRNKPIVCTLADGSVKTVLAKNIVCVWYCPEREHPRFAFLVAPTKEEQEKLHKRYSNYKRDFVVAGASAVHWAVNAKMRYQTSVEGIIQALGFAGYVAVDKAWFMQALQAEAQANTKALDDEWERFALERRNEAESVKPMAQLEAEAEQAETNKAIAEAKAKYEALQAEAKAKAEAEEQAKAEAKAQAKAEAEAKAKAEAEAMAKAQAKAKAEAEAKAQAQAETNNTLAMLNMLERLSNSIEAQAEANKAIVARLDALEAKSTKSKAKTKAK